MKLRWDLLYVWEILIPYSQTDSTRLDISSELLTSVRKVPVKIEARIQYTDFPIFLNISWLITYGMNTMKAGFGIFIRVIPYNSMSSNLIPIADWNTDLSGPAVSKKRNNSKRIYNTNWHTKFSSTAKGSWDATLLLIS